MPRIGCAAVHRRPRIPEFLGSLALLALGGCHLAGAPEARTDVPSVTLEANPTATKQGEAATLHWVATNAESCTGSGDWSGPLPLSGSTSTSSLMQSSTFTLTCSGAAGSASQSVTISVSDPPAAPPTVDLQANPGTIANGAAALLVWSSTGATDCAATEGWNGPQALAGSQSTGPLTANTSYSLTCIGPGGSASASTTVAVTPPATGSALLTWTAPTKNLDGSPLTDLSGYLIYYGSLPGQLSNTVVVPATTTQYQIDSLTLGTTWYFAVAAVAADGTESVPSNIGSKSL